VCTATTSFAGGAYHGLSDLLSPIALELLWKGTLISIGLASFSFLSAAAAIWVGQAPRRLLLVGAAAKLGAVSIWIAGHDDFRFAILDYGLSMALVLVITVARFRRPGALWIVAGIGVSAIAVGVQQSGIRISAAIGHNDLYHLIQIVALACLCRGARLSTASEIASFAEVDAPPGSLAAPAVRGEPPHEDPPSARALPKSGADLNSQFHFIPLRQVQRERSSHPGK